MLFFLRRGGEARATEQVAQVKVSQGMGGVDSSHPSLLGDLG